MAKSRNKYFHEVLTDALNGLQQYDARFKVIQSYDPSINYPFGNIVIDSETYNYNSEILEGTASGYIYIGFQVPTAKDKDRVLIEKCGDYIDYTEQVLRTKFAEELSYTYSINGVEIYDIHITGFEVTDITQSFDIDQIDGLIQFKFNLNYIKYY